MRDWCAEFERFGNRRAILDSPDLTKQLILPAKSAAKNARYWTPWSSNGQFDEVKHAHSRRYLPYFHPFASRTGWWIGCSGMK
jgi:hypothetical protein